MKFALHSAAHRIRRMNFWAALGIAAAAAFANRAGAAIAAPEKLLPDDTLIVLTAPDCAKMREIYRTSPMTQLWNDPAMKPFRDKFTTKLKEELIQPLERELGVQFGNYTNLAQGQLTFAMTKNGWPETEKQSPGLLLLLDAREKSAQLKSNLSDLRKKWVDSGKKIKTEKVRDVEFSIFQVSEGDVPKSLKKVFSAETDDADTSDVATNQSPKTELVVGQFDSLLILGNSMKPVEKVVVHLTGGAMPALGDLAAFEANRLTLFRDAPMYGWINVKTFIDILSHQTPAREATAENPFAAFSMEKVLAPTGISGLKTMAFSFRSSPEGSFAQFFVGAPESGRQGLVKILAADAKEAGPPPFVPADTVKFQRWRIDGQKAWATLEKMLTDLGAAGTLNYLIETANSSAREKDPNFDVRKNLFGNLGDDLITYQKAPRGSSVAELSSPPWLLLVGSPHPAELLAAVKNVLGLMNQQGAPAEREFLGRKIYSQPFSLPLPTASAGKTLSYTASGSYLAITMDTPILEEYLRSSDSQQKALRATPGLSDAIAKVGGSNNGVFGYENQAETMRSVIEVLRKSASSTPAANAAPGIPAWNPRAGFQDWLDFSLLPPFEKIAKYFSYSVYAGSANADGITLKMFAPVPPALKK